MSNPYTLVRMHVLADRIKKISDFVNEGYDNHQIKNPEAAILIGKLGNLMDRTGLVAGNVTIED